MSVGKSGWLEKRGDDLLKGWKKRWCKLEDGLLKYYASPEDSTPKGEIVLRGCSVELVQFNKYKRTFCFEIHPVVTTRVYVLQASSSEDRQDWLSEIKTTMLRLRREASQEIDARKMEILLQQQEQDAVRRITETSMTRPAAYSTISEASDHGAGYVPPALDEVAPSHNDEIATSSSHPLSGDADASAARQVRWSVSMSTQHDNDQHAAGGGPEQMSMDASGGGGGSKYEKYMSWLEETKNHSRRGTAASREESGIQQSLLSSNPYGGGTYEDSTETPYASMDGNNPSCCDDLKTRAKCIIQ